MKVRYIKCQDHASDVELERVRRSELYKIGGVVHVWANEGDISVLGECIDTREPTAMTSYDLQETVRAAMEDVKNDPRQMQSAIFHMLTVFLQHEANREDYRKQSNRQK